MDKTYTMFAAVNTRDPYQNPMCVCYYANAVRKEAGLMMDEDAAAGWKWLRRLGWRVRKVRVVVPLP
jgi:hypothetical protein